MKSMGVVNVPVERYIALLEMENAHLKRRSEELEKFEPPPFRIGRCPKHEITKRIQERGMTVKSWAHQHGFPASSVKKVTCGYREQPAIVAAMVADGLIDEQG
ncbi:MAG: hypothetical protein RBS05_18865 [Zoogloea oleivorans]|jgi:hypothetical protein|uniref:hypothetical protein n=1 Tax=Zoogloea oleivorans TaxID=1552750 RepID=UPI002A363856|nr:hypothetical protein [Zoogloea oleivorans]MDY0037978.1 hypothetical protein [Zoogloea oleivorans]